MGSGTFVKNIPYENKTYYFGFDIRETWQIIESKDGSVLFTDRANTKADQAEVDSFIFIPGDISSQITTAGIKSTRIQKELDDIVDWSVTELNNEIRGKKIVYTLKTPAGTLNFLVNPYPKNDELFLLLRLHDITSYFTDPFYRGR